MVKTNKNRPSSGKYFNDRKAAHKLKKQKEAGDDIEKVEGEDKTQKQSNQAVQKVKKPNGISKELQNKGKPVKGETPKVLKKPNGPEKATKKKVKGENKVKETKKQKKEVKDISEEVEEEESGDESIEIGQEEIDDLEIEMEKQNNALGEISKQRQQKSKKSRKDKERKVIEFKFRVLDLIEIFIKKTNNPHIFVLSLASIFQSVKAARDDKEKAQFVEKICLIIKKFFSSNLKLLPEYADSVDSCLVEVMKILAKESKKTINSALSLAALSLFKIRMQMNLGNHEAIVNEFVKALEKSVLKKDICYNEDLFKEVIKASPETAYKLLEKLISLALLNKDGGSKDKNKPLVLNLLAYASRNQAVQKLIVENKSEIVDGLIKLTSVFTQHEELKKKKIGILHKYFEIYTIFAGILKEQGEYENKKELKEKLKQSISSWDENDHNLKAIQKKITEKCIF